MLTVLPINRATLSWLLLTLAVASGFIRLGIWQLDRAEQKERILQSYATTTELQALEVSKDTPLYNRTSAEMVLLSQQLLLDNQILDGRVGVHVLTPTLLSPNKLLLINRGWLPISADRLTLPDAPLKQGQQRISGRLAPIPQVGLRLGQQPALNPNQWPQLITYADFDTIQTTYRDVMQQVDLELLPFVLQLDLDNDNGFAGRNWSPVNFGPKKHLAYALQWFTLALAVIITWLIVSLKTERKKQTT